MSESFLITCRMFVKRSQNSEFRKNVSQVTIVGKNINNRKYLPKKYLNLYEFPHKIFVVFFVSNDLKNAGKFSILILLILASLILV